MVEMYPYWWARAFGGLVYLLGLMIFIYNLYMTATKGNTAPSQIAAAEGRA